MQRHQPADKFAPNHKAFRFQIIHHLASAHSRMLRVLMVNLTHNLKVPVRFALKRFVVVHAVGKPQCVTLLLDGKALVTRGYHSSAGIGIPSFREACFANIRASECRGKARFVSAERRRMKPKVNPVASPDRLSCVDICPSVSQDAASSIFGVSNAAAEFSRNSFFQRLHHYW